MEAAGQPLKNVVASSILDFSWHVVFLQEMLQLLEEGYSIFGISRETGFTRKTVRLWLTRYDAEGHLDVRHGPGRPRATTEEEDASIVARAKETPLTTATSIKH